jgi:hypothetical protein
MMLRLFRQKYISLIIASFALALAMFTIFEPKIKEYNSTESKRQAKLKAEANGEDYKEVSFELSHDRPPLENILIVILTLLFLSLLFTRKIFLSFLFIFIFCVQSFLIRIALPKIEKFMEKPDWWFDYSVYIYFDFLLLIILSVSSFWLAFSISQTFTKRLLSKNI